MISIRLYWHNRCNIVRSSLRNLPYIILRRRFGTQTIWYLHSHTVCDRLLFIFNSFRGNSGQSSDPCFYDKELTYFKYYSTAFSILPGEAGGLALELNVLIGQCLNRRIDNFKAVKKEVNAWQQARNNKKAKVNWQFTAENARIKLRRLYPTLDA